MGADCRAFCSGSWRECDHLPGSIGLSGSAQSVYHSEKLTDAATRKNIVAFVRVLTQAEKVFSRHAG